jgi:hypothetical protein
MPVGGVGLPLLELTNVEHTPLPMALQLAPLPPVKQKGSFR